MNSCIDMGLVLTNTQQQMTSSATFANLMVTGAQQAPTAIRPGIEQALEPDQTLDFRVYPNPVAGVLQVDLNAYLGRRIELALLNMQGQLLLVRELGEVGTAIEQLDLSGLPGGVYQLQVRTDGAALVSRRVIVHKM
jgi:hypothetical protein